MKYNEKLYYSEKEKFYRQIKDYISNCRNELIIICPYIRSTVLKDLISNCKCKITIITTWKLKDLQTGSSDLKLYNFCKKNKIYLFLNQRIHLKAFINNYESCVFGSANISNRGLALTENYNYELAIEIKKIDIKSIFYFKKILKESTLLNENIYKRYKKMLNKLKPIKKLIELNIKDIETDYAFLISSLPMSYSIDKLFNLYSNDFKDGTKEEIECAIHDVLLYNIPENLNKREFLDFLKKRFFESKFILKILEVIDEEGKYFGRIKKWVQKNCKDVPVPSMRDLTGNIQVLYKWIVHLSDGKYKVDRPNYSEKIYKVKKT